MQRIYMSKKKIIPYKMLPETSWPWDQEVSWIQKKRLDFYTQDETLTVVLGGVNPKLPASVLKQTINYLSWEENSLIRK